ncbi:Chromosome partition protein smc [Minicystis rosea]|nr:Chromosome partition protein smc [Minicystis rosea]
MRRPFAALAFVLALLPGAAAAQRVAVSRPGETRRPAEPTSLRAQMGIPVAQRLLLSEDPAQRVRGVERLGAIGTPEAFDALIDVMESNGVAQRDARMRLTAVRVLAAETKRAKVRALLQREVTDTTDMGGRGAVSPLGPIIRGTAALALARGGDRNAVSGLAGTLLQPGPGASAAAAALRAYPPEAFDVFLDSKPPAAGKGGPARPSATKPTSDAPDAQKLLSPPTAAFLGESGDMRAVPRLRALLAEGEPEGKLAAGLALARLGDESALPVAREWAKRADPRSKLAAAEALIALDAADAGDVVTALLENRATRDEGLRLALRAPGPALVAPLAKLLPTLDDDAIARAVIALGRARGLAEIVPLLDKPETATETAFALARMPGAEARAALEQALAGDKAKGGEARRLLLRAATVRALVLDDAPSGLRGALKDLWKAADTSDRAVGAFGLVALGWMSLEDVIEASCKILAADDRGSAPGLVCEPAIVGAAARGALALPDGPASLEPLLPLLARASRGGDALVAAAGAVLLAHPDGADLPTPLLAVWAESGGPIAPLAARALPARDDEAIRGRIKRLLAGSDPVVRAHVALGLGRDPEPSAVSLLVGAYRFEEDAVVRRAVVRGLSRRTEAQREATLVLARDLDPDEDVRALARAALAGRDLEPRIRPARGPEPRRTVAWITVRSTAPRAGKEASLRAARLVRPDGLAVPVLAEPDGVLLVPGLPPGPGSLLIEGP